MSPAISFSGETSRGPFFKLILRGAKVLTTRYPRLRGRIEAGDIVNLYWNQRTPAKDKPIHLIGKAYVEHVYHVPNLLEAILTIPDYFWKEGFETERELLDYWGVDSVTVAQTGPLDVIKFKLKVET